MQTPDENPNLERLIHRTLRELPPRPAPRSLEQRVLAELARRAALPWWRKSFAHWPVPARALLLVACVGTAKLALMAGVWAMAGFDTTQYREAFASQLGWVQAAVSVGHALFGWVDVVVRSIPPLWLYGGLAFAAAMYAALFGLGAVAYRAIRAHA
jgi:hypothetical protein